MQDLYQVGPGDWAQTPPGPPPPVVPGYPEQAHPIVGYPEQVHPIAGYPEHGHHPAPPQPEPRRGSGLAAGVIAGLAAVALLTVLGVVGYLWFSGGIGSDEAASRASSAAGQLDGPGRSEGSGRPEGSGVEGGNSTPAAELGPAQALTRLEDERSRSVQGLSLDGRWVLQLSSKYPGVEDATQTAPISGGHVFQAHDIWMDYQNRKAYTEGRGMPVLLVRGDDFGRSSSSRKGEMFVVLADPGDLTSRGQAEARCADLYPGASGRALDNLCLPRRLNPPS